MCFVLQNIFFVKLNITINKYIQFFYSHLTWLQFKVELFYRKHLFVHLLVNLPYLTVVAVTLQKKQVQSNSHNSTCVSYFKKNRKPYDKRDFESTDISLKLLSFPARSASCEINFKDFSSIKTKQTTNRSIIEGI